MQYPSFEARLSREQVTQTLMRICERLDTRSTTTIPRPYSKAPPEAVKAVRLWVVGSYARGAWTCGDLDLVMELDHRCYADRKLNRQLLKSPARVSLYTGTPEDNSSQASFGEAVLVWEPGYNWRAALESIKPNETATRFDRPTDRIPLRMGQMSGCGLWWAEPVIERHERGELAWHFVALEELYAAVEQGNESEEQADFLEWATRCRVGAASKKLLPYLLAHIRRSGVPKEDWRREDQTRIRYGSTVFFLGTTPSLHDLNEPGVNEVVVMPHLSSRGPNGMWVIKRGPQHPLVRTFKGCEGWVVTNERDNLALVQWSHSVSDAWSSHVESASIFRSEQAALDYIESDFELDSLEPGEERRVRHLKGEAFLEVLDSCQMLDGGLCWTVFSETGKWQACRAGFDEDDLTICSIEELAALFRPEVEIAPVAVCDVLDNAVYEETGEAAGIFQAAWLRESGSRSQAA
jgi:hypothetical protein